ncbi:MAG: NAD(P)/FAD-dependent oxidoreductase [Pseudomonadota bacterium]
MSRPCVNTVIVGGGQAGLAMSIHLKRAGIDHIVFERNRIAESWRTERWDSLVANGPAWHDRFPDKAFADTDNDGFATKGSCVRYFEEYARDNALPVTTGVNVHRVTPRTDRAAYEVHTTEGVTQARNVIAATGPFQVPVIPPVLPSEAPVAQLHSQSYRNPDQLAPGAVLVVGGGSSGSQIADELLRAGRTVFLSIGPHDRPPRRYRGHDYCHWLGVLGKWDLKTPPAGREHVTIAVTGAYGGYTVDFRRFAERGMTLLGMTDGYADGKVSLRNDLAQNIAEGDANYLSVLDEVDAYITANGLALAEEPEAKVIGPSPACVTTPMLALDLRAADVSTVIWATGYRQDFGWLEVDTFDGRGNPRHQGGIAEVPGIYFLGLPWLSMRGSSFIWGVYKDAERLAKHIQGAPAPSSS